MSTMNEKNHINYYILNLMNQKKVNIWLDCDVGNDDAMAIILGLFDPKSNLIGISACFGNTRYLCSLYIKALKIVLAILFVY